MVSLELEARLDNLLSNAQTETTDIDLFTPIPESEECPVCMIPLHIDNAETIFMHCCGKRICRGCVSKHWLNEIVKGAHHYDDQKCIFCRQPPVTNQTKSLRKLMKKNNPHAFIHMASAYASGNDVMQSNTKALEMLICAAELGHADAYERIGKNYEDGYVVEKSLSKALAFWVVSAKKGSIPAHKELSVFHGRNENIDQYVEHLKVAAIAGDKMSMDHLMKCYKNKLLPKEDLAQILRAHQAPNDLMKSKDRDFARNVTNREGERDEASEEIRQVLNDRLG